jgi:hypothetical protein
MQGAGINPARIQSVLRQASDQQLMMMLRRPDKIPSMFVQQELQRRAAMRQNAKAQQAKMQTNMNNVSPQNFGRDMDMSRTIGLKHGGMHFSGIDIDEDIFDSKGKLIYKGTGMPYAGGIRRDFKRFPNPRSSYQPYAGGVLAKTKFGQAYRPGDVGQPNTRTTIPQGFGVPYTTSKPFISEDMKKTMKSGVATKDLIDYDLENVDTASALIGGGSKIKPPFESPNDQQFSIVQGLGPKGETVTREAIKSGIKDFYSGPIKKGENPFKTSKEQEKDDKEPFNMQEFLKSQIGGGESTISKPNYDEVTGQLDVLKGIFEENNKKSKSLLKDKREGITTIQSMTDKRFEDQLSAIDDIQDRKKKLLLNTKDLDELKKKSEDNYESAINYLETDTKIADAQKKLLEAMKPQATPAQKFFGYIAQIGADIAGSDRDTFLEAGGAAISTAIKDYKFDNEQERERFINNAKLMLEFENLNQQNKMKIFDLKGGLYNMQANNVQADYDKKMNILNLEENYNTAKFGLSKDREIAFANFEDMLSDTMLTEMNLNSAHAKDMFSIVEGKSAIVQQKFANDLSLANNEMDRMQIMASFLTPQIKNFNLLQALPEDQRADFLNMFSKSVKNNVSPDVTARTLATDMTSKIDKIMEESSDPDFTRQDAMKQVMGDQLFDAVVGDDGSLDYIKLYQYMFGGVYNIQMTGGINSIAGSNVVVNSDDYKKSNP